MTRMTPSEMARQDEARRLRYMQVRQSITQQQAANIAALARENPSLSPGALYAAGVGGVRPGTAASRALAEGDLAVKLDKKKQDRGFSVGGLLGGAYRGAKAVGSAVLPDFVGDSVNAVAPAVKGISRGTWMGTSAIGQTFQGAMRESARDGDIRGSEWLLGLPHLAKGFSQTDLAAGHREIQREGGYRGLVTGSTDVDFGSGFFAGGDVESDAVRRRRATALTSQGKAVTIGRYAANSIGLEPGGIAYNTVSGLADAAMALGSDPTSYVAAPIKALQARTLFAGEASAGFVRALDSQTLPTSAQELALDMGAIDGLRRTVSSDRVLEFLTKDQRGRKLVQYTAQETDFARLWDATKGKLDPKLVLQLTERQHSPDEVIRILGPVLGRSARTDEKFGITATAQVQGGLTSNLGTIAAAKIQQRIRDTRIFGTVPQRVLPKNDLSQAITNMDRFLANAKIGGEDRGKILARLAATDDVDQMFEVATDAMALGVAKATDLGIPEARARELFRMYANASSGRRAYWQDQIGRNKAFGRPEDVDLLDNGQVKALPHLAAQFLNNSVPLPDPREIRAAISPYRNLLANPAIKLPLTALEKITDNIFKPAVLLRPAYVLRNQIDEQFRPAGMGLNSMFNHPVQYLSWLLTDETGFGRTLARVGVNTGRGAIDVSGRFFDEQQAEIRALQARYKDAQRAGDRAEIQAAKTALENARSGKGSATPLTDGASAYVRALSGGVGNWRNRTPAEMDGTQLFQRSDSDYARAMGEALHLIHNDPLARRVAMGQTYAGDVRQGTGTGLDSVKEFWWRGEGQRFRTDLAKVNKRMSWLEDEIGAAQYVDETAIFIDDIVGGSVALREAAATGKINGVPLTDGDTLTISDRALAELDRIKAEGDGPDALPGKVLLKGRAAQQDSAWDRMVDGAFYQLADRPTKFLSKSPAFRQRYYQRMEHLIGFMAPDAQQALLAGARDAKLKSNYLARLERKARPDGTLTLDEADLVAKTDALEYTKELFYDLTDRSQFFDVTRLLFPFGEAFKDSAKKYAELVARNPVLPYRLGQGIQAGRSGDLDGDGEGFLYTDEQTGEEVFAWPGSGALMEGLGVGAVGQFRSPVKNLNILGTSVIPGFGPVVQIGVASLLPDEADFAGIRDLVSPYGERTLEGGALESFLPAWFSKFRSAELIPFLNASPAQSRAFLNAQKDVMGYLYSTGEYDTSTPDGIQRLQDDAKTQARAVFFIRGMAQAFAPSPPSPEFVAHDKDGRLHTQFGLAEQYRKIQQEAREAGEPGAATRLFLEKFGQGALLAVMPNTTPAEGRSPFAPTKDGLDFYRRNRKTAEAHPAVFGLFAPNGGDFDFGAYDMQLAAGDRKVLTPDEAVERTNQRLARMIYGQAQAVAGPKPNEEQRARLRELRQALAEDFPGYSTAFSNDTPALIEDLKRAAADPVLGSTDAGRGLQVWLRARDAAEQSAQARFGTSWTRADKAAPLRDSMRALADMLGEDFPGFTEVYEQVLEREMVADR